MVKQSWIKRGWSHLQRIGEHIGWPYTHETPLQTVERIEERVSASDNHNIIRIENEMEWQDCINKLKDMSGINSALQDVSEKLRQPTKKRLTNAEKLLCNVKIPDDVDELSEEMANLIYKVCNELIVPWKSCHREKNPKAPATEALMKAIEEYFTKAKVGRKSFKPGDDYDRWADLGMDGGVTSYKADYDDQHNTLRTVESQPLVIRYQEKDQPVCELFFGGECTVWSREGDISC